MGMAKEQTLRDRLRKEATTTQQEEGGSAPDDPRLNSPIHPTAPRFFSCFFHMQGWGVWVTRKPGDARHTWRAVHGLVE